MKTKVFLKSIVLILLAISCTAEKKHNRSSSGHNETVKTLSQGNLVIEKQKKDFGKFKRGQIIICDYGFYNNGSESIKIVDYEASCTCSEIKFSKMEVQAGDSLTVTMVIQTVGKIKGKHNSGAVLKTNGQRKFYNISSNYEIE